MSMTRKHYVAVAKVLDTEMVRVWGNVEAVKAVESIAESLADMFKADNLRFDRPTFYNAASVRCYHGGCVNYGHKVSLPCRKA